MSALLKDSVARKWLTFSFPKSDLIHWRTKRQCGPVSAAPITLDGTLILPSQVLRWLGYWLIPSLNSNHHFTRCLSLANVVFSALKPMLGAGKGLPPFLARRLVVGVILPVLTYGADLLVPSTHMLTSLTTFWNRVLRWIANCFYLTRASCNDPTIR